MSRAHKRYRQTTDRQTDRQTDGRATAYSERSLMKAECYGDNDMHTVNKLVTF